jgi:RNA polymerase sigma factor (TIGR02999 family)
MRTDLLRRSCIEASRQAPSRLHISLRMCVNQKMAKLTELIHQVGSGDSSARDELFAATYPELRKLARSRLRDGGRNTFLETTALVHETYLRFQNSDQLHLDDRRAFFAYASKVMRSVVIDSVREHQALRRGGDWVELTLDTQVADALPSGEAEILHVHEALLALEATEPRLAKVVEMRYFGGYSESEIADALGLTERTVRRDWDKARLLLMTSLRD